MLRKIIKISKTIGNISIWDLSKDLKKLCFKRSDEAMLPEKNDFYKKIKKRIVLESNKEIFKICT